MSPCLHERKEVILQDKNDEGHYHKKTIDFLIIFVASVTKRIFVTKKDLFRFT